jgi:hypothetical protein
VVDSVRREASGGPYPCPCCRCVTLPERGFYDVCPVCFWEDDGQDDHDAEVVRDGPNGALSLAAARDNYARYGACEATAVTHVRPALPHEIPR